MFQIAHSNMGDSTESLALGITASVLCQCAYLDMAHVTSY